MSSESLAPILVRYVPAMLVLVCGFVGRRRVSDVCLVVLAALFGAMTFEVMWDFHTLTLRDLVVGAALVALARLVAVPFARRYDRRHPAEPMGA